MSASVSASLLWQAAPRSVIGSSRVPRFPRNLPESAIVPNLRSGRGDEHVWLTYTARKNRSDVAYSSIPPFSCIKCLSSAEPAGLQSTQAV